MIMATENARSRRRIPSLLIPLCLVLAGAAWLPARHAAAQETERPLRPAPVSAEGTLHRQAPLPATPPPTPKSGARVQWTVPQDSLVTLRYDDDHLHVLDGAGRSRLFLTGAGPDGAAATRFAVPPGAVLDRVLIAPFFRNQFAGFDAPRDVAVTIWDDAGGQPGNELFSLPVDLGPAYLAIDPNVPCVLTDNNSTDPCPLSNFFEVDLSAHAGALADLPSVIHVGYKEQGPDTNYVVIAPSQFSGENVSHVFLSGGIRAALWDVSLQNGADMTNTVIPVRAVFRIDTPDFAIHDTGTIRTAITDQGNIGWTGFNPNVFADSTSVGVGFELDGVNLLFEGGFLMGTGVTQISSSVRGAGGDPPGTVQEADFRMKPGTELFLGPGTTTAEEGRVVWEDTPADAPTGVLVTQQSYADTSPGRAGFVVFRYILTNTTAARISGLHAGLFFDWDLNADARDFARYDAARRMSIVQNAANAPGMLVGTALLAPEAGNMHRAIDNAAELFEDGFTDDEKWAYLSGGVQTPALDALDVSTLSGAGPFTLEAGCSAELVFALVAGTSSAALEQNADTARQLWEEALQALDTGVGPAFTAALPDTAVTVGNTLTFAYRAAPKDACPAPITYRLLEAPEGATLDAESGLLAFTPVAGQEGTHPLTVEASDGNLRALARAVLTVTPAGGNRPPVVENPIPDLVLPPGDTFTADLTTVFSDPDGDPLSFFPPTLSDPSVASADLSGNTLVVTALEFGDTQVIVSALDPNDAVARDTFMVAVRAEATYETRLSGIHMVPDAVPSTGTGQFTVRLNTRGDTLTLTGSFEGLGSTYAASHLHEAGVTANGPVRITLQPTLATDGRSATYEAENNTFALPANLRQALETGNLYVLIHSATHPGGEIRGQLYLQPNNPPPPPAITSPEAGAFFDVQADPDAPFRVTWEAVDDPDGHTVFYAWQLATTDDFATLQVSERAGTNTSFEIPSSTLDALLNDAGVQPGGAVTWYHRVVATDGSAPSAGTPRPVTLSRGPNEAPAVAHTPAAPTVSAGQDVTVSATITDASGLSRAVVRYRQGGTTAFTEVVMTPSGNTYTATIPASAVTARGLQYFIRAEDAMGLATDAGPFTLRVRIEGEGLRSFTLTGGSNQNAYRLVSVPLALDDTAPRAVLEDDLGPYDDTRWRLFGLRPDQSYAEFPGTAAMTAGTAFWLIVSESTAFDTGPGTSNPLEEPFTIALHERWNFIGTPFAFDVPLSRVRLASGAPLTLHAYNGAWSEHTGALQPFRGYAVFASTADELLIDPFDGSSKAPVAPRLERAAWHIRIRARVQQARDENNLLAAVPSASKGRDAFDQPEPPVIGAYVSVYFPHPEWDFLVDHFSTDARPEPVEAETWTFEVRTNIEDRVELDFEGLETVPASFEVWLVDPDLKLWHDVRATPGYAFEATGEDRPKRFELIVARPEQVQQRQAEMRPRQYSLQNFPNPFNPATTLHYGLPEEGPVTLVVYNLLGEQVAVLLDRTWKPAGYHTAHWDGRDDAGRPVASGVYLGTLRAGSTVLTKTMVLVK
ncbi:CHRD domain-containing protein [Rhodocaloribacter litoris]|uniref:CHRD domain-containing protein n=1 Tax=Rhodocaloribacter litoris TaxID=2558931 RepID=UPI001422334D|nr:CHRD domain-containing protein [Rhodocaloribacter litoris]QXD13891.1 CHRD domain-containing protein [Rhodocaloribacter litoris]